MAFESPLTVDESHVAKVKMLLRTKRATELCKLLFQFKDTVSTVYNEKFVVNLALAIFAITKPVEAIVNLTVPGPITIPSKLFNVP